MSSSPAVSQSFLLTAPQIIPQWGRHGHTLSEEQDPDAAVAFNLSLNHSLTPLKYIEKEGVCLSDGGFTGFRRVSEGLWQKTGVWLCPRASQVLTAPHASQRDSPSSGVLSKD